MLGIALVLAAMHEHRPLGGTVRIIFQPAEETMPGGALACIDQGVLDGVPRILALHCDPRINIGQDRHPDRRHHLVPRTPSRLNSPAGAGTPRVRI